MRVDVREVSSPPSGMGFIVSKEVKPDDLCFSCNSACEVLHDCGNCPTCCLCMICQKCNTLAKLALCSVCYCCVTCCTCYSCARCHSTVASKDHLCKYCGGGLQNICGCCRHLGQRNSRGNYRKSHDVNLLRYVAIAEEDRRINPSPRLISAEMETCGINYNELTKVDNALSSWHCGVVGDGTLPEGGFEINTHPAGGDYWVDLITDVCRALSYAKGWVNERAGCHMHVDCRDYQYLDLAKALRILGCVEAGLYAMIPAQRSHSESYCQYWCNNYLKALRSAEDRIKPDTDERKTSLYYRAAILRAFYGHSGKEHVNSVARSKGHMGRYRGVNLHSFLYRGTIEFRMPPGMVLPDNIINWGMLLANILDVAKHRSMAEIVAMTTDMEKKTLPTIGLKWRELNKDIIKSSVELLGNFAPTPAIADWIIERVKWAPKQKDYKEAY